MKPILMGAIGVEWMEWEVVVKEGRVGLVGEKMGGGCVVV